MKARALFRDLVVRLSQVSREPEREAKWILEEVTGKKFEILLLEDVDVEGIKSTIQNILNERIKERMPLPYIFKKAYFMDFELYVDERVLIPRPDTEVIVEYVIERFKGRRELVWVDVCTGSGAIALSLFKFVKGSGFAVDISKEALAVARYNAKRYNAPILFLRCDLLSCFCDGSFDLVVSNPPYIGRKELTQLEPEIFKEPLISILGGEEGHELTLLLLKEAYRVLKPGGSLIIETSVHCWERLESEEVVKLYKVENVIFDYSNNLRGLHFVKE